MFEVGDEVICNDVSGTPLKIGVVYRITELDLNNKDKTQNRVKVSDINGWFFASRFELAPKKDNFVGAVESTLPTIVSGTPPSQTTIWLNESPPKPQNVVDIASKKASKNDAGKIDLSLIPKIALEECAKAFMVGEKRYGRYNYCKGHNSSQLVAAAMRHLTAWNEGEEHDPTDGQHHLGSVMACCAMILKQVQLGTIKDNRFKNDKKTD